MTQHLSSLHIKPIRNLVPYRHISGITTVLTHPNPYSSFGGRPFFRQAVQEVLQELQQTDTLTLGAFAEKANTFLSRLQDGHTYLSRPRPALQDGNRYAPIWFRTINGGIIVSSVTNTLQQFLPPHDPRAKTFYPDLMPDYEEYRKHGFDAHTDILFLLDKIK